MSKTALEQVSEFASAAAGSVRSGAKALTIATMVSLASAGYAANSDEAAAVEQQRLSEMAKAANYSEPRQAIAIYVQLSPSDIEDRKKIDGVISRIYSEKADFKTFYKVGPADQKETKVIIFVGGAAFDHDKDGKAIHGLNGKLVAAMKASINYHNIVKTVNVSSGYGHDQGQPTADNN